MSDEGSSRKTCFVVGPIGEDGSLTRTSADWLLKGVIKPVFAEHFGDFDVIRSDTITQPGMIDVQMINHLINSALVVVDMSERNPNAFYEMGIRHMAAKPVIHMFAEGTAIPFDVAPYRAIRFNLATFEGMELAKVELRSAVAEAIKPDFKINTPVTRAVGAQVMEQTAPPEIKVLYDEVAALRHEMSALSSAALQEWKGPRPIVSPGPLRLHVLAADDADLDDLQLRLGRALGSDFVIKRSGSKLTVLVPARMRREAQEIILAHRGVEAIESPSDIFD